MLVRLSDAVRTVQRISNCASSRRLFYVGLREHDFSESFDRRETTNYEQRTLRYLCYFAVRLWRAAMQATVVVVIVLLLAVNASCRIKFR